MFACRALPQNDKLMGSRLELEGHPLALVAHAPSQSVLVSTTASKVYRFSAKVSAPLPAGHCWFRPP